MKFSIRLNKENRIYEVKVDAVYYIKLAIDKIIHHGQILWSFITSCFGSGTWISTSQWSSTDLWKNN